MNKNYQGRLLIIRPFNSSKDLLRLGLELLTGISLFLHIAFIQAPGNGLVLCQVHYDQYNLDWGSKEGYSKLEWDQAQNKINNFAKNNILPQIFKVDIGTIITSGLSLPVKIIYYRE